MLNFVLFCFVFWVKLPYVDVVQCVCLWNENPNKSQRQQRQHEMALDRQRQLRERRREGNLGDTACEGDSSRECISHEKDGKGDITPEQGHQPEVACERDSKELVRPISTARSRKPKLREHCREENHGEATCEGDPTKESPPQKKSREGYVNLEEGHWPEVTCERDPKELVRPTWTARVRESARERQKRFRERRRQQRKAADAAHASNDQIDVEEYRRRNRERVTVMRDFLHGRLALAK